MARGSKSRNRSSERDTKPSLTTRVARAVPLSHPLSLIQDFRTFDPAPASRPVFRLDGAKSSIVAAPNKNGRTIRSRSLLPSHVGFADAPNVIVCVRRKRRREVLFAKRKTRKGAGSRRRRNQFSNIRC